jgi:hypothetical protein
VVDADDDGPLESRPPGLADLVSLCRSLNREGAQYIVVGGMAIIQAGLVRATEDIDLLVDASPENVQRLRLSLDDLPDHAVRDMAEADLDRYVVVRVADEIVVDLMKAACGITFGEAKDQVEVVTIDDVAIPFATPALLWRTKQTFREKDRLDRIFLAAVLGEHER